MVGSIDPRCETVRGTHWPNEGRVVVWSSRRGNHLGQRSKAPHQQAGHMDASDPIRPSKNSCGTGAVHIWVPAFAGTPKDFDQTVCSAGERSLGTLFLPNAAADFPVSAASTSATMWSRRSSLASLVRRSRPKITLSVALFDR